MFGESVSLDELELSGLGPLSSASPVGLGRLSKLRDTGMGADGTGCEPSLSSDVMIVKY